jgi:hypothetical protein
MRQPQFAGASTSRLTHRYAVSPPRHGTVNHDDDDSLGVSSVAVHSLRDPMTRCVRTKILRSLAARRMLEFWQGLPTASRFAARAHDRARGSHVTSRS